MHEFLITAGSISGNKGAESMFTALYQNMLKIFPDSHFYLLSPYPRRDRLINKKQNVTILSGTPLRLLCVVTPLAMLAALFQCFKIPTRIFKLEAVIGAIIRSDIVFDIGGITFSDGREIYLPYNIVTLLPAILLQKRIVKCSQAMGPFKNKLNRFFAKRLLPNIDVIFARGSKTKEYLDSIGLCNTMIAADIAFRLDLEDADSSKIKHCFLPDNTDIVGISPSSVVYKQCRKVNIDYIDIMRQFCDYLADRWQFKIVLIPHSIRPNSTNLKNNDLPVIQNIAAAVSKKDKLIVIEDDLTAAEFRALIQQCRFFIASRFHSMVSALAVRIPLLVCGWGHKYTELLEQFNFETYAIDYRDLSLKTLTSAFDLLVENEWTVKRQIENHLPEVLSSADKHFDLVKQLAETHA